MSSNFDKTLEKMLKQTPEDLVDGLDESGEEEEEKTQEMVPVYYEEKESSNELIEGDFKDDYTSARSNLHGLLGDTNSAIRLALQVAAMSEHPRALEVVSNLIKTSADISKDILSLHKELKEKQGGNGGGGSSPSGSYTQINNNYYSKEEAKKTEDILDQLDDAEESKDDV